MKIGLSNKVQFYGDGNIGQSGKQLKQKYDMLMNDLKYKTCLKNWIRKKGLIDRPIPRKLSNDRFGEIAKRFDDDNRFMTG